MKSIIRVSVIKIKMSTNEMRLRKKLRVVVCQKVVSLNGKITVFIEK